MKTPRQQKKTTRATRKPATPAKKPETKAPAKDETKEVVTPEVQAEAKEIVAPTTPTAQAETSDAVRTSETEPAKEPEKAPVPAETGKTGKGRGKKEPETKIPDILANEFYTRCMASTELLPFATYNNKRSTNRLILIVAIHKNRNIEYKFVPQTTDSAKKYKDAFDVVATKSGWVRAATNHTAALWACVVDNINGWVENRRIKAFNESEEVVACMKAVTAAVKKVKLSELETVKAKNKGESIADLEDALLELDNPFQAHVWKTEGTVSMDAAKFAETYCPIVFKGPSAMPTKDMSRVRFVSVTDTFIEMSVVSKVDKVDIGSKTYPVATYEVAGCDRYLFNRAFIEMASKLNIVLTNLYDLTESVFAVLERNAESLSTEALDNLMTRMGTNKVRLEPQPNSEPQFIQANSGRPTKETDKVAIEDAEIVDLEPAKDEK